MFVFFFGTREVLFIAQIINFSTFYIRLRISSRHQRFTRALTVFVTLERSFFDGELVLHDNAD